MIKWMKHPVWFVLFIALLLFNIAAVTYISNIFKAPDDVKIEKFNLPSEDSIILSESTIKSFIDLNNDNTKIYFKKHHIWIKSQSEFMSLDVDTIIKTTPEVIAPGVVALNIEKIDIGKLPLSKKKTLSIVDKYGDLPNEVSLDAPNKRFIYNLGELEVGKNKLLLKKIDKQHRWHFNIELKE